MKTIAALLLLLPAFVLGQTTLSIRGTLPNDGSVDTRAIDLNGDGKPDLLSVSATGLSVRLNDGSGTFPAVATVFPLGLSAFTPTPRSYTAGDFNNDGRPDFLALTNLGVFFYAGDGKGGFGSMQQTSIRTQINTLSVVTADFNRDGMLDFAFGSTNSGLRVFAGNGLGDFRELQNPLPGGLPGAAIPALQSLDVNGDGIQDIVGSDTLSNAIYVVTGSGTGGFGLTQLIQFDKYTRAQYFVAADFDRDGKPDLVICIYRAIVLSSNISFEQTLEFWTQNSVGIYARARTISATPESARLAAVDVNGDGKLDLIATGDTITTLYIGDGAGLFTSAGSLPVTGSLTAADFDGNGRSEGVITNAKAISILTLGLGPSRVTLYRNLNPFTFGQTEVFTATVDSDPALSGFPTGTVRLLDNGQLVQTAMLFNGVAHFSIPFSTGQHRFRAEYDGDRQYGTGSAELAVSEAGAPANIMGTFIQVSAIVTDLKGIPVSGVGVIFTSPLIGPSGTFLGSNTALAITGPDGVAVAPQFIRNGIPGLYSVALTISGYPDVRGAYTLLN